MWSVIVAAGIPTSVLGFCFWTLERRIERREKQQEAAEKAREEFETHLYEKVPLQPLHWARPLPGPCSASRTPTATAICTPP